MTTAFATLDRDLHCTLASSSAATAAELTEIVLTGARHLQKTIANRADAPAAALAAIVESGSMYRSIAVRHPNLSPEVLRSALGQSNDAVLSEAAARNPKLDESMIASIIEDGTANQRFHLVENPALNDEQLDALAAAAPILSSMIQGRRKIASEGILAAINGATGIDPDLQKILDRLEDLGAKEWKTADATRHRYYVKPSQLGAPAKSDRWASQLYFDVKTASWVYSGTLSAADRAVINATAEEVTGQRIVK